VRGLLVSWPPASDAGMDIHGAAHGTAAIGPMYSGRFESFPVPDGNGAPRNDWSARGVPPLRPYGMTFVCLLNGVPEPCDEPPSSRQLVHWSLFIGCVPVDMTEPQLVERLRAHGVPAKSARIRRDRYTGRPWGYPIAEMPDAASAQRAPTLSPETKRELGAYPYYLIRQ
jgi:hypothetical protein